MTKVTSSKNKKDHWITIKSAGRDYMVLHIRGSDIIWKKAGKNELFIQIFRGIKDLIL